MLAFCTSWLQKNDLTFSPIHFIYFFAVSKSLPVFVQGMTLTYYHLFTKKKHNPPIRIVLF